MSRSSYNYCSTEFYVSHSQIHLTNNNATHQSTSSNKWPVIYSLDARKIEINKTWPIF